MEAEYDIGSKKLDISQYINDTNVTAEIKYALIQNRAPPVGFKFPPKEYKDKRRVSGLSKDTASTAGSQSLALYHTFTSQDGLYCTACALFHTEPRENNHVCLFTSHTPIGKTLFFFLKSDLQNQSQTESHRMSIINKTKVH